MAEEKVASLNNPTIVVTWYPKNKPEINPFYCSFTAVEAVPGMRVRVKGAGFKPEQVVYIAICEQNKLIGKQIINRCGAFQVVVTIPPGTTVGETVSIKAIVSNTIMASWPLNIVKLLPKPPK